jgi:hypothetical protein
LIPEEHFKSVDEITQFWRFGIYGDTTKRKQKYVDELNKISKIDTERISKMRSRINMKIQSQNFVKGVVDRMSKGSTKLSELKRQGKFTKPDWYLDLVNLDWDEIEKRFFDQQMKNQKQSQVH